MLGPGETLQHRQGFLVGALVAAGEDREIAIGCLDRSICVLVYTKRGGIVRIISLRKANKRERKHYEEAA